MLVGAFFPIWGLKLAPLVLCVADAPHKAEAIVLLGGEDGSREEKVVELFKAGWAPLVIISGDLRSRRDSLIHLGIPAQSILVDDQAKNTAENAFFTIRLLRAHNCHSALIVTSWFHTRRAGNCFFHYGRDLSFYLQPTYQSAAVAKDWGPHHPAILWEYPKNLWYMVRYGIFPF